VNLARKDKQAEPSVQVLEPEQIPVRQEGDAIVRVLVGEGSPVRLGAPALVLDIELAEGGEVTTPIPPEFQASPTYWKARRPSVPTGGGRSPPARPPRSR
jgi:redox-sensitive bicupin YhaK (pirin superfamily)